MTPSSRIAACFNLVVESHLLHSFSSKSEKTDPLVLAFLLGTAVGAADNAALVRHGEKIEIFGQRSESTSTVALPATLMLCLSNLT